MIPNEQAEDASVSNYSIQEPNSQMRRAQWVKQKLESSNAAKIALFTITILGTAMVMGDGTLTPAISGIYKRALSKFQYAVDLSTTNLPLMDVFFQCSLQLAGSERRRPT
jgi:hypothetical protein